MTNETAVEKLDALIGDAISPSHSVDETINNVLAAIQADPEEFGIFAPRKLARQQPCGCVVCICESDDRCNGCGAKGCGNHPVGEMPNPVFQAYPMAYVKPDSRTAACVTALAGVKDPEGLMKDMRGAIEALDMEDGPKANQKGADHLNAIRKHLKEAD